MNERILRLLADSGVQAALTRFSSMEAWLQKQQMELTAIAAPTGLEGLRAEWMLRQMKELGLRSVDVDEVGNVIGFRPGVTEDGPVVAITAHLDTVFPARTPIQPKVVNGVLTAPGISDNGAGLAALLGLLRCLQDARLKTCWPLLLVANVGEEGEGDLKGFRHLFGPSPWNERIAATIVLDGPGVEHVTVQGLGSRRLKLTFRGPGGHSWSEAGTASAIHGLVRACHAMLAQVQPEPGESSFNLGVMEGGSSINSIAAEASVRIDLRAHEADTLQSLAAAVRRAAAQGMEEENQLAMTGAVEARLQIIGDRPAGKLAPGSELLHAVLAVDRALNIEAQTGAASTDANLPLSLGRQAIRIGAGGRGGGAHTLDEWFDPTGRHLGLRRLLLLALLMARVPELDEQDETER